MDKAIEDVIRSEISRGQAAWEMVMDGYWSKEPNPPFRFYV